MFRTLVKKLLGLQRGAADPQLVMWFPCEQSIPEQSVPKGFVHRPFKGGDEIAWCELLNANGQLGVWGSARMENEQLKVLAEDGQRFVSNVDGKLVACAGVYDRERVEGPCWEIGWIAVDPAHQGLGLGGSVVAEALRLTRRLTKRPVYLLTDDFRIPAIKTYLKLGFIPDWSHPSYEERWKEIFASLGSSYAQYECAQKGRK